MVLGDLDSYVQKKMKPDHQLTPYTKVNLRWIKDLNHDTIKDIDENIGRKISDILHSNIFTTMSPRARDIKERINKWDLMKIESFFMPKENSLENQDGGIGRHTAPPHTTRTDRKSNGKGVRHQGNKK